jgi:hypothetical protein
VHVLARATDEQVVTLPRLLTDRGTEYCGTLERHEYESSFFREDFCHDWNQR